MLMRALLASLALGALLAPSFIAPYGTARAQQTSASPAQPPLRQACRADFQKFCADVHPGSGRIAQCLLAHKESLSPACRDGLARIGAEHQDKSDSGKPQ
jgi:Cysteine rich repeat